MDAQCVEQVEQVDRTRVIGKRGVAGGGQREDLRLQHAGQTAWYFAPFQRTQYLEINNPINTPTVFASMS